MSERFWTRRTCLPGPGQRPFLTRWPWQAGPNKPALRCCFSVVFQKMTPGHQSAPAWHPSCQSLWSRASQPQHYWHLGPVLCGGGCPGRCKDRMWHVISGLHPLKASISPRPAKCDNQICLRTLPDVPWEQKHRSWLPQAFSSWTYWSQRRTPRPDGFVSVICHQLETPRIWWGAGGIKKVVSQTPSQDRRMLLPSR